MALMSALQMSSSTDVQENLKTVQRWLAYAADRGVKLVVLPEMFACMGPVANRLKSQETFKDGPVQIELMRLASLYRIWIIAGTLAIASDSPERYYARCLVINDKGGIVGQYDKIHLFDIKLSDQEHYRESAYTRPGDEVVVVPTPWGALGLAVCYDVRFPELFRRLVQKGAEIIALPAAFKQTTGRYHWDVLLRARAIENSCYLIAPNQAGREYNGHQNYGHSMIIDPWGHVMTQVDQEPEQLITAEIDQQRIRQVRQQTPFIEHRRLF